MGVTSALHLRRYLLRGIFGGSSTEWCSRLWLLGLSRFHGQRGDKAPDRHGLLALIPEGEVRRPGLSLCPNFPVTAGGSTRQLLRCSGTSQIS